MKFLKIPEQEFRHLSVTHIAVLNADIVGGESPEVFIELPIEEADGKKIRGYWIKVAKEAARDLAGRFSAIVNEAQV